MKKKNCEIIEGKEHYLQEGKKIRRNAKKGKKKKINK